MKRIISIIGVLILAVGIGVVGVFIAQPRIPLGSLAPIVTTVWNKFSDNELVISGDYYLIPGEWLNLIVKDGLFEIRSGNGFKLSTSITSAETKVQLSPLFKKQVFLDGISLHGLNLDIHNGEELETNKEKKRSSGPFIPAFLRQTGTIDFTDLTIITNSAARTTTQYHVEEVSGRINRESPGKLAVKGTFDERTLAGNLEVGSLENLNSKTPLPFTLQLAHKSIAAEVSGQLIYSKEGSNLDATFSLSGDHFDDLLSLFGSKGSKNKSFSLAGQAKLTQEQLVFQIDRIHPGTKELVTSILIADLGSKNEALTVSVEGSQLDFDSLSNVFAIVSPDIEKANQEAKQITNNLDLAIFPTISLTRSLSLKCNFTQLVIKGRKIDDVTFDAEIINGIITNAPFAATFENSSIRGHYSLDLSGDTPKVSAHLLTNSWDIGATLEEVDLARGFDLYIENVISDYETSGRTLRELVRNLVFSIKARNGTYHYEDPNTKAILPISIHNAELTGKPGSEVSVALVGDINANPISILIKIDDRRDESPELVDNVSTSIEIHQGETRWFLEGTLPIPYTMEGLTLNSRLTGESLSDLNSLLELKLPQVGPYGLKGIFQIVPEGYKLSNVEAEIGSSALQGNLHVNTRTDPPELLVDLQAKKIQLDDFRNVLTKPEETSSQTDSDAATGQEKDQKSLTDQTVINNYNAKISAEVKEVFSGADYLGNGLLKIEQQQGKFKVSPLRVSMPSGDVSLDFSMEPHGNHRRYAIDTRIEELDYGVVGRWFKPDTDMAGVINARSYLKGESPDYQNFMSHASGYIDVSLQPEKIRSGVIDLWAVNLLSFLVPFFTPNNESKINCAAGRFNINEGILNQDGLIVDTSRVQVKGTVEVDLKKGWIEARLRPIPKRPQFISLATPIQVSGDLKNLKVGVARGGLINTMVRLVTSYIVVPIQWIILDKKPEDGTEECLQFVTERLPDDSMSSGNP